MSSCFASAIRFIRSASYIPPLQIELSLLICFAAGERDLKEFSLVSNGKCTIRIYALGMSLDSVDDHW